MTSNPSSRSAHTRSNSVESSILRPGDQIGRYELTSILASGGMGQVWAARPIGTGFGRTVAIKLLRPEVSGDDHYARMFIDEATVASSIHHPNVCETYELGKHGDRLYMAMEWVAGETLAGLLRQQDALVALEPRIAARIVADACAGLHAAHETVGPDGSLLGVVHRDISPPNILVSTQGQAKVSDFGIAKARYQLHERTRTGEVKGKFAYIPPEQISGGVVDRRADVYAMGCVLYVASIAARPFGNGADALRKILSNDYKAPRSIEPEFPEQLEAIIVKALAPRPDDRFQTAEEMQIALEEWLLSAGKLTTASDVAKRVRERLSPDMKTRIEALMSINRVLPETLMNRLAGDHDSETPTAGDSFVNVRSGGWQSAPVADDQATVAGAPPGRDPGDHRDSSEQPPQPRTSDATRLLDVTPYVPEIPAAAAQQPRVSEPRANSRHVGLLLAGLAVLVLIASLLLAR